MNTASVYSRALRGELSPPKTSGSPLLVGPSLVRTFGLKWHTCKAVQIALRFQFKLLTVHYKLHSYN